MLAKKASLVLGLARLSSSKGAARAKDAHRFARVRTCGNSGALRSARRFVFLAFQTALMAIFDMERSKGKLPCANCPITEQSRGTGSAVFKSRNRRGFAASGYQEPRGLA
jgi:hypothetical protein